MTEPRKKFWAQPDADMPKVWVVCTNPDNARIVAMGYTKEDAEAMAVRLNGPVGQQQPQDTVGRSDV